MKTPEAYQRPLLNGGGRNIYGEPNLILAWGGDPVVRSGCQDQILPLGLNNCWCLLLWRPAEEFGAPELWSVDMGAYPSRGLYMVVQAFRYSGKTATLDSPVLNPHVLSLAAKVIMENIDATLATRDRIIRDHLDKEQKEWADKIEDIVLAAPPLGEMVSYAGQKNCNSVIQQKMDQIEKCLKMRKLARLQMPKPGFSVQRNPSAVMAVEAQGG